MSKLIKAVYFSPTGSTRKVIEAIVEGGKALGNCAFEMHDVTLPKNRGAEIFCGADDALLLAFPVYAGRLPIQVIEQLRSCKAEGAPAVIVACYGNRHYDNSIAEAASLLQEAGFTVVLAGAFSCQHSFTANVGAGRPDAADIAAAEEFGRMIVGKLSAGNLEAIAIPGEVPTDASPTFDTFAPAVADECSSCSLCAGACPAGAIGEDGAYQAPEKCFACGACIKACPQGARSYKLDLLSPLVGMLEGNCAARREPEFFTE